MAKIFQRFTPFYFDYNALLRIPQTHHAIYVFWSVSKSRAVYVGKTDLEVGIRLRQHWKHSHNVILRSWINYAPEDLMVCYACVPEHLVLRLEGRLIRLLDPEANELGKS